jgi:hypothetical protein
MGREWGMSGEEGRCIQNIGGETGYLEDLDVDGTIMLQLTLCSRATTKVVFSVNQFDPRSRLSSFSHTPFYECVCQQV